MSEPQPVPIQTRVSSDQGALRPRRRQHPRRAPGARKFAAFATVTILAAGATLAALWPQVLASARAQSLALVGEAAHAGTSEAATDYRLAAWLDSHNQAAYIGLARAQIAAGLPDAALTSLSRAGQGSAVDQLKVRTLIELGRNPQAASAAAALVAPGRSDDDRLLAVLAYANAGRTADAAAAASRLSSPEAARRAARAQGGKLTLGAELYVSGLLRSSAAVLAAAPTSYERNVLLGRIHYSQHTKPALSQAAGLLQSANSLDPSNTDARLLLANVYTDLGNPNAAAVQKALVAKLQAGRP